jgi:hypothetical protein
MRKRILFCSVLTIFILNHAFTQVADHWETIIYASDTWRYYVNTGTNPDAGWYQPSFDDSSWPQAPGGFGYADNDDATMIPNPPYPVSVQIRIAFDVTDTAHIAAAVLNMDYDDGFIAWINGTEVVRFNMGNAGNDPALSQPATDHEAVMYQGQVPPSFLISKQKLTSCLKNGQNILAIQVNNFGSASSDLSCIPFLSAGITTTDRIYRDVPDWFVAPYTGFQGSTLPLVIVKTNGASIGSEVKVMVDFGIVDNGEGNLNKPDDPWNGYKGKAGIEYRGSSSMMFPKKNYGIETRTITGTDSAVSLLGMPVEADWVMHGPYSDKSLVRNKLAYDLSRNMGHYAPRTRFCELFVDNQYQGVYVLMEKIKRDSNRVNIAVLDSTDISGYDLTGGYIIKIDRSADGSYLDGWYSPHIGSGSQGIGPFFAWHYPKWENILPVQMNYIKNKVTHFEDALFSQNYRDPYAGYRPYIDVISFIDYFILVEVSKNVDGYRLSTFLYKDRDDRDPRIHMGPVWDYDLAFGNADYYDASVTEGWNYPIVADGWGTPLWWTRFMSDSYFTDNLKCRWTSLREGVLSDESITDIINAYTDSIGDAQNRNFTQWPIHGMYVWPNAFVGNSYFEDVNYLRTWILNRIAWLDIIMPGNCTVTENENEQAQAFSATIRPNPGHGSINIELRNPDQRKLTISIINMAGITVDTQIAGNDSYAFKTFAANPGLYLVKITDGVSELTIKALVE